jgi:uncharacterized protein
LAEMQCCWRNSMASSPAWQPSTRFRWSSADVDRRDPRFTPEQLEALTAASPGQIGPWIVTLNEWRLANCAPAPDVPTQHSSFAAPSSKVGRNDPCPCGSGKKYKKCCGLN